MVGYGRFSEVAHGAGRCQCAASQLVGFLGGLDYVRHDAPGDPRVGMVGGSYGGEIQFAAAAVDPRVDTIVPMITWHDLAYSLAPNNATPAATPGALKLTWGLLFVLEGALVENVTNPDPGRVIGCPNFPAQVCTGLLTAGTLGYLLPATTTFLRHASVATYADRVHVPTLLIQGQKDTLFNLNEAVATYDALRARGTDVSMIWQSWGHSGSPAPGEIDLGAPDPATQYVTGRIMAWFDHYLKDLPAATGPNFAYYRDWVPYTGNAAPAYAASPSFPVGTAREVALSGGAQTFLTPPAGVPTSLSPFDAINEPAVDVNLPGTFASGRTARAVPEAVRRGPGRLGEPDQPTGGAGPRGRPDPAGRGDAPGDRAPLRPGPPGAPGRGQRRPQLPGRPGRRAGDGHRPDPHGAGGVKPRSKDQPPWRPSSR